jgi:hypothetical protein
MLRATVSLPPGVPFRARALPAQTDTWKRFGKGGEAASQLSRTQ